MFADRTNWNLSPNRLSEALAAHLAADKRLYDLSASNPTEEGFERTGEAVLHALAQRGGADLCARSEGTAAGAAGGGGRTTRAAAMKSRAEDIILTTSTSEAYSFVFRTLCNPGDELLVPAPSYPLFGFLADIHDVRLVQYRLIYDYGWQIDFHALEQAITPRTRGIIVVNPNNPTGHFVKPDELATLNEICSSARTGADRGRGVPGFCVRANPRCAGTLLKNPRNRVESVGRKPQSLAVNTGGAYVHDERAVENFRPAADEGGVAGGQRTGRN